MPTNKELQVGLKAMSEDYHLPGVGLKRLSRLVASHLWWFDAAERRGMSWRDMIRALSAADISGKGGQPLSVGTLSSTVWRARAEKEREADKHPQRGLEPEASRRRAKAAAKASRPPAAPLRQEKRAALPQEVIKASIDRRTPTSSPQLTGGNGAERANKDVLAYMDRARRVRRRSEV